MLVRLTEAGEGLRDFPLRGRRAPDGVREWPLIHPYVIRYDVVGDEARILGVRHGKRG